VQQGDAIVPGANDGAYKGDTFQDCFYITFDTPGGPVSEIDVGEYWINLSAVNNQALNWASITFTMIIKVQ